MLGQHGNGRPRGMSTAAILTLTVLGFAASHAAAATGGSDPARSAPPRLILAQNATTTAGTAAQGATANGTAGQGASTSGTTTAPAQGTAAGTAPAATDTGVNANTSAAGAADETPPPPKQPAVETTPFGLTIYRGSGS